MNADLNLSFRPASTPYISAARLACLYLALASLWIVSSDALVEGMILAAPLQHSLQTLKGLSFILVTAGTFYLIHFKTLNRLLASERKLEAANARLTSLLETSPIGFVAHDEEGRVEYWNGAAERLFGWKAEEVLNRPDPVLPAEELERLLSSVEGTAVEGVELRRRRRDGSMIDIQVSLGASGNPRHGRRARVALISDLSEQQRAFKSIQRFQLLAEHTEDVVLFTTGEGRIVDINLAAATTYGYAREELIGQSIQVLALEADTTVGPAGRTPPGTLFEVTRQRKNGERIALEIRRSRMLIDGEPVFMEIGRDLTPRRRDEAIRLFLRETDQSILRNESLEHILDATCEHLAQVFELPLVWLSLRQPDGQVQYSARGGRAIRLLDMILGDREIHSDRSQPDGRGAERGRISSHPGVAELEQWGEQLKSHGLPSLLSIPLTNAERPLGSLCLTSSRRHAFDEQATAQLTLLANQLVQAILTIRNRDQLRLKTVAIESAPNAVVIFDRDQRISWVNRAFTALTGYHRDEVIGTPASLLESNHQPESFYQHIWRSLRDNQTWHGELYCRRKNGTLYLEDQTITPVRLHDEGITHFIAIKRDVTERKQQDEQIRYLSLHDALTDLPNRRSLEQHIEQAVIHARGARPGALVLLDVDNFKAVNELGGHAAGDQLLVALANLLNRGVPARGFLARLGSDEFAVLLDETTQAEARALAERMILEVNDLRFTVSGTLFPLSASLGIAAVDGSSPAQAVLGMADTALYTAKSRGKNRTVCYQGRGGADAELVEAGQWGARIKEALRENRMVLYFQPVVNLNTGRADHFEALIRMQDENGKIIPPGLFIPAAERFGLMPQIDSWVTNQVLKVLHERPNLRIFMNLSGQSLGDEDLLEFISSRARNSGILPGHLVFELTETVALSDLLGTQRWMEELRNLGCQFALDDFGSGFSAFSYLRALPADYVKIDGSFVRNIDTDANSRAMVQAITTVAHALGKEVIAEWVEGPHIAGILRQMGIEHGQGYHWGAPNPRLPDTDLIFAAPDLVAWAEAS